MDKPHAGMGHQARRYDNDWLTVLAMLTIFFFHCARFFNYEDWHVKNNQLDEGLTFFVAVVGQWVMPLFFLLSGLSTYYSLCSRTNGSYLRNRIQRLLIPFVFGTFVLLIPVQVWIERVSHVQFADSFLEFYPHYFEGFYAFGGNFAWMGLHLWYLEMLFIFSLLTLPLFLFLKQERLQALIAGTATFFEKKGAIFLFAIPIFIVELLVNLYPEGVGIRAFAGWSPVTYLIVFVTGFWLAVDLRYREAMARIRFISLGLGLLSTGSMFLFPVDLAPYGEVVDYMVSLLVRAFNSWFWLVAILGFGSTYLNFTNDLLKYAREAVLPFYVIHQTVIVVIGFYIANWDTSVMVKYLTLSTFSFVVIIASYELLIKPINVLRFLFGMKAKSEPSLRVA